MSWWKLLKKSFNGLNSSNSGHNAWIEPNGNVEFCIRHEYHVDAYSRIMNERNLPFNRAKYDEDYSDPFSRGWIRIFMDGLKLGDIPPTAAQYSVIAKRFGRTRGLTWEIGENGAFQQGDGRKLLVNLQELMKIQQPQQIDEKSYDKTSIYPTAFDQLSAPEPTVSKPQGEKVLETV